MRSNNIHPDILYSVSCIYEELKKGGGISTKKITYGPKSQSLIQTFKTLGWKQSVLQKRFKNLTDEMLHDENELNEEHLRVFANLWYDEIGFDTTIAKTLINMGLTATVAKKADVAISPLIGTCYTESQIIQIAIQYLLGYYNPITPPNATHFYKADIVNEWIVYYTGKNVQIPIINLHKSCNLNILPTLHKNIHHNFSRPGHKLYFHTTSWAYCISILDGIDHSAGHKCLDFGVSPSFYVSEKMRHAIEWGNTKRANFLNELGTIIFSIPDTIPSNIYYKELKGQEWNTVTIKSRKCIKIPESAHDIPELNIYDIVYGNMLMNSYEVKKGDITIPHNPPKKQLASKSSTGDIFLQGCIVGCIVFNKNELIQSVQDTPRDRAHSQPRPSHTG